MPERKNSTIRDTANLAFASFDTALVATSVKLATLQPEGIKHWLAEIVNNPSLQQTLPLKALETGLTTPFILGSIGGIASISLIEKLRSLYIFGGAVDRSRKESDNLARFNTQLYEPIEYIFGDPSKDNDSSNRFNLKYGLAGFGLGYGLAFGEVAVGVSLLMLLGSDIKDISYPASVVGHGFGVVMGYYIGRKFGYYSPEQYHS